MSASLRDGLVRLDQRLAVPILSYPGALLVGRTVRDVVTDATAQVTAQLALHERFDTPFLLSPMDLGVEAEAFGASVALSDWEVPTVTARLVHDETEVTQLAVPAVGARRTSVYLESVRRFVMGAHDRPVIAGMTGPFTLAARLFGISETLVEVADRPEMIHSLIVKTYSFLSAYGQAFKDLGACGVLVAEPVAGLVSPAGVRTFSSAYMRRLVAELNDDQFDVIVHNCAARLPHLPAILETGARIYHFGESMDVVKAMLQVPPGVVVCGNLDPVSVFVGTTPASVRDRTMDLLNGVGRDRREFVLSSGCDLPVETPLANIDAFFAAVRDFNAD
jgi:uroporphyrinogen decarboxylase